MLEDGNSLPTRVRRVGGEERTIIKAKGTAAILLGDHNRPTGSGTRCRTSTNLLAAFPGLEHFNVPARIRACDDGMPSTARFVNTSEKGYITAAGNLGFGNTGDNNLGSTPAS